jgi:hypothetical protein
MYTSYMYSSYIHTSFMYTSYMYLRICTCTGSRRPSFRTQEPLSTLTKSASGSRRGSLGRNISPLANEASPNTSPQGPQSGFYAPPILGPPRGSSIGSVSTMTKSPMMSKDPSFQMINDDFVIRERQPSRRGSKGSIGGFPVSPDGIARLSKQHSSRRGSFSKR